MTYKIDGTNGVLQQYDYQTPTTGFSYTFGAGVNVLVMQPAGTLATGTIIMPALPVDGMTVTISSTKQITALTIQGNTGQSIVSPVTFLPANQATTYVYRLSNTTWYPMSIVATNVPVANVGGSIITSGTANTSLGGTGVEFTGIPSWVKRVTVMFNGLSTSSTSPPLVQIGAGSVANTGYLMTATTLSNAAAVTSSLFTTGFALAAGTTVWSAATTVGGSVILTLVDSATGTWSCNGKLGRSDVATTHLAAGSKVLSGTLDRIRITTVNGTDLFDAGSINILYE
jgi:hypothetical protein